MTQDRAFFSLPSELRDEPYEVRSAWWLAAEKARKAGLPIPELSPEGLEDLL